MAEENTPISEENTGESPTINNNITVPPSSVYVNIPDYSEILNSISTSLNAMSNKTEKLSTDFEKFSKDFEKIKEITEKRYEVEKTAPKDYWDTLRHQYFIILMQGILSRTGIFTEDKLIGIVSKIVDASIKKMKSTTNNS